MSIRRGASIPRLVAVTVALASVASLGCGDAPRQSDPRAVAKIGPAGGVLALSGGPTLDVPAGALPATTDITIEPTGLIAASGAPVYAFGPAGTTFSEAVTVTLPLPPGLTAPAVYWSKPGSTTAFDVVEATITPAGVQAQGTHFSRLFVGPSTGGGVCADAGTDSDGTACGGGRRCVAGACVARISGTVSGVASSVTVTLSGDAAATTTTDDSGRYEFGGLAPGSYTVTPSSPAQAFTPQSASVAIVDGNVGGQDFVAWRPILASVNPEEGHVGSSVTLAGDLFGPADDGSSVTLGGVPMPVLSWSDDQIVVEVPSGAVAGDVEVHVGTGRSVARSFVVTATVQGLLFDPSHAPTVSGNWASPAQLIVSALGMRRSALSSSVPGSGYGGLPRTFSLELPVGTHTLVVQELDGNGDATLDLLQTATRQVPGVVVPETGVTGLELPVRWHWEVATLDPGFPVCGFERQIHFRDADHGFVTFQVNPGVDPAVADARIHGMAMATSDGGRTWTVASHDMSPWSGDFRPTASGWYPTGSLLALEDGTVLSVGDVGQLARSVDSGATWASSSLNWANLGPGGPAVTRFARAGDDRLYVSVTTGGVQGSYERSQLLASEDEGLTWERIFDVCNTSWLAPDGCPTQGVPLGFAGIDMACSDVHPERCITMGYEHDAYQSLVMITRDGFETFQTIEPACGYFTDGQVLWFPGTDRAWVVAGSSCPGVGYRYIETTDGGATWSDWAPSPLPGHAAFVDAQRGMSWWNWGVRVTRDGGDTWLYTGRAPTDGGALASVHVLDADHAWVLGHRCQDTGAAFVARWVP